MYVVYDHDVTYNKFNFLYSSVWNIISKSKAKASVRHSSRLRSHTIWYFSTMIYIDTLNLLFLPLINHGQKQNYYSFIEPPPPHHLHHHPLFFIGQGVMPFWTCNLEVDFLLICIWITTIIIKCRRAPPYLLASLIFSAWLTIVRRV